MPKFNLSFLSDAFFLVVRKFSRLGIFTRIYENELKNQIIKGPMPRHIGLILDGNRRWSSKQGVDLRQGYETGANKLQEVLRWIYDLKINIVTIYALSTENLKRPKNELETLFSIFHEKLVEILNSKEFEKYNVKVKFIGKREVLPQNIVKLMEELEKRTEMNNSYILNIAIGYGGRQEIVDAIKNIVRLSKEGKISIEDINEQLVEKFLYTSHLDYPSPDLIIRTSGEFRISNFLIWQSAYSEFFFADVLWPDFRKIDLYRAIRTYQSRKRRFGQ